LVFVFVFHGIKTINWFFWFISDFDGSIDANIDVDKELKFNQKKCQLDSPHEWNLWFGYFFT
jgi:hypothetical protein